MFLLLESVDSALVERARRRVTFCWRLDGGTTATPVSEHRRPR
jgi:hypothetical protein